MATIRQKGNRLQVQIRLSGHPQKTHYFPLGALEEAQAWAEAREAELGGTKSKGGRKVKPKPVAAPRKPKEAPQAPAVPVPPSGYPMTLRQALERYEREVTPTKKGARQEHGRIRLWLRHPLADKRLSDITAIELTEWRQKEEATPAPGGRQRSPSTVCNKLKVIAAVYEHARTEWAMPLLKNPCRDVKKPKQRRGRDVKFTQAQREHYWEVMRARVKASWAYYITKMAVLTAMRQGELRAALWEHWSGSVLHLPDTKNDHPRDVPLSSEARGILKEWHGLCGSPVKGLIFPVSALTVTKAHIRVVRYIRKRDPTFPHITFHDLRHVAATDLSKKLSNVLELSAVTGHRSIQVLKRYYNPDPHELAKKLG